jgi:hypothetical protein
MKTVQIVIAWLRKEDWPQWRSIDPKLPTYDHWLRKTEGAIKKVEKRGLSAEKVIISPDDFLAWCSSVGCKVDRNARSHFAATLLLGHMGKRRGHSRVGEP